jgi:hypothetical protein
MKRLLFLFAFLFSFLSVQATHMMGADMSYQCLGNGKYKIIAKVYRDCRGVSLSPVSFGAFAGTNGSNQCGSITLTGLTRTGIKDVTTRCSSSSNPCNPSNVGFTGKGVEEHTFEATIDFTTSPLNQFVGKAACCEITFYVGQCCRNGGITTGAANQDFYTTCMINICNINKTDKKCFKCGYKGHLAADCRVSEKKKSLKVFDIVDDLCWKSHKNHVYRHFEERVKIYKKEKFDYKVHSMGFTETQ